MVAISSKGGEVFEPEEFQKEDDFEKPQKASPVENHYVYRNILMFVYWHLASLYGLYLCFASAKWMTLMFQPIMYVMGILGLTAGAHRLWSHKSYKAKLPLQILLMIFNSCAYQTSIIRWARDHRLHHRYSDTDGDPHNANRGLFFSHVGWLLMEKHPEVKRLGKNNDISDLLSNPLLVFQEKFSTPIFLILTYILPTYIPVYFWGESWNVSWHINMLRYVVVLNVTSTVNSLAHSWGYKPYDHRIRASQNTAVTFATLGECFHNYHHVFPWDYKSSEIGDGKLNFTTKFIDFFARLGWAYDLKTTSDEMIAARMTRTGDGSRFKSNMNS